MAPHQNPFQAKQPWQQDQPVNPDELGTTPPQWGQMLRTGRPAVTDFRVLTIPDGLKSAQPGYHQPPREFQRLGMGTLGHA